MVTEYIQTITDGTVGNIIILASLGFVFILIGVSYYYIVMNSYKNKAAVKQYYLENVIAFKVGLIHKEAKDNEIELKFL